MQGDQVTRYIPNSRESGQSNFDGHVLFGAERTSRCGLVDAWDLGSEVVYENGHFWARDAM